MLMVMPSFCHSGGGSGMGIGHAPQCQNAFVEIILRGLGQRVSDILIEQCQRYLFQLVAGVMQGGYALVDQKLSKAVDRYCQFNKAFKCGRGLIALPCVRQSLSFLQEFFGRAKHERGAISMGGYSMDAGLSRFIGGKA